MFLFNYVEQKEMINRYYFSKVNSANTKIPVGVDRDSSYSSFNLKIILVVVKG